MALGPLQKMNYVCSAMCTANVFWKLAAVAGNAR